MAQKRANGEGSINRRKDGRWQAAATVGYDANGKQVRKFVYGRTKDAVRKKLDALKQTLGTMDLTGDDLTLDEYLKMRLETKARHVKPRTVEFYEYNVKKYISPRLGRTKLSKLTPLRIQQSLGQIADEVSPNTSNNCRSTLGNALDQAVKLRLLGANPISAVDRLRVDKKEMIIWSTEQVAAVIELASEHRLYPLFYLGITSGLRIGEILALSWDDLDGNRLRVRRNLTKQAGVHVLADTKTAKGRRLVTLAHDILAVLDHHKGLQEEERELVGDGWANPGHMFTTAAGTYLDYRNVLRVWHGIQKKVGVPQVGLHGTRHLHVSLLHRHGVDQRTIADRVGHTNPAFTLRLYTHVFEQQEDAAAVPLDDLLSDKKSDG